MCTFHLVHLYSKPHERRGSCSDELPHLPDKRHHGAPECDKTHNIIHPKHATGQLDAHPPWMENEKSIGFFL
ncbi:hypothetical protein TevJSym_am00330 [endosymbiont of Tevnia jerichonana (vent Tica)]|uniref:Uncharacterized protein n=1 Tax=endosymbiont of Tevnia jerichonana (vent Tica) TaxID=1049564 RepID=G2FFJ0_9GAMM|nr:hypothetical protein TevJSym_am00330 [endosymbiont of Tevnia jerichonana (vent Tica)]